MATRQIVLNRNNLGVMHFNFVLNVQSSLDVYLPGLQPRVYFLANFYNSTEKGPEGSSINDVTAIGGRGSMIL